jgi:hypothetical protein
MKSKKIVLLMVAAVGCSSALATSELRRNHGGSTANQEATATDAIKLKAEALVRFLETKKDKRVEKVVLNKYNWAGVPSEELVNYNIKIGDTKYTVERPGKAKPDAHYLGFNVRGPKGATEIVLWDRELDGRVDQAMDVKNTSKEEKKQYGAKGYELKDRERWQAEYEKTIDALSQYLGVTGP